MTSKKNTKPGKSEYTDAEAIAQNLSRDPGVKTSPYRAQQRLFPTTSTRMLPPRSARKNWYARSAENQPSMQNSLTSLKPG